MWIVNVLEKIEKDKWEHYSVAFTLTRLLRLFLPRWLSALIVLAICIAKEVYDKVSGKGTACWSDIVADIVGILVGML